MMEQLQKAKGYQNNNQRFRFNISRNDLECFISKPPKSKSKNKRQKSIPHTQNKPFIKVLQQHSPHKAQNSPYFNFYFDHKVLFTHYGSLQVYVDEQPSPVSQTSSNDPEPQDQKSQQILIQCLRAITDQTADNSTFSFCSTQSSVSPSSSFSTPFNNDADSYRQIYPQSPVSSSQPTMSSTASSPSPSSYSIHPGSTHSDGRTTLMLRNIPNKYTQQMILQQLSMLGLDGKYDFFYLPIDFKNDCNVGYAFVNLVDVNFVADLYGKFHGKKWRRFNSEKICQVCYARIQGTMQLMNHFRFSNTLQRDNRFRPLIYLNLNLIENKNNQQNSKEDAQFSAVAL